jgi:hypothetical protein
MKDELVSRITERIASYSAGDPRPVIDHEAIREAMRLWQIRQVDAEVLRLLSWLHWARYLALPDPQKSWDGNLVAEYSIVLRYIDPDLVIEPAREAVAAFRPPPGETPQSLMEAARGPLQEIVETGAYEPGRRFGRVLDILHRACNGADDNPGLRAAALAHISGALLQHYRHVGLEAYGDAAVQAIRSAIAALPARHQDRAIHLVTLCSILMIRHERTNDRSDLDAAVQAGLDSIAIPSSREILMAGLTNLQTALETQLAVTGDPAIRDTISWVRRRLAGLHVAE